MYNRGWREPLHKWLNSLKDRAARARIRVRLNRVRLGNFGDCKPVGKGVYELRVDYGPGYRVYYGKFKTTVVILLLGGSKKSQSKDIELAQAYWADFKRRAK
ncbi:MAG: type II toxin-antitoxin system RelE/ParE family toxin [Deltaproteobacteria bacterium]|nr:type II toxin-antitoxin system RelE/ParE family toxin [Deltaproteobacteria bacterium]